jgi:hypothetical protein
MVPRISYERRLRPNTRAVVLASLWFAVSLVICFGVENAWAAPSISTVSGTVGNGQSITINGSGFGANGPNVLLFEDFEKGTVGQTISTASGSAQVGNWSVISVTSTGNPGYSNSYVLSGSKSGMANFSWWTHDLPQMQLNFSAATDVYWSFWQYLPSNRDIPGTNNGDGPNWKFWWLGGNPNTFPLPSDYVEMINTSSFGNGTLFEAADDTNSPTRWGATAQYPGTSETKGAWCRKMVYFHNSTSSGTVWYSELTSAAGLTNRINVSGVSTAHSGELWQTLIIPGYGRDDSNAVVYYDDVYVATGAGARARVEIGDNATYTSCHNLAVCTPTSWSNTSITATARTGSFVSGSNAYLFVIDAGGAPSVGKLVTIGSGSGSAAIGPAQGLTITGTTN